MLQLHLFLVQHIVSSLSSSLPDGVILSHLLERLTTTLSTGIRHA